MPYMGYISRPVICGVRTASSTVRGRGRRLQHPIVFPPQNWFPTVACEVIYHRSFQFPSPISHYLDSFIPSSLRHAHIMLVSHTDKGGQADKILHDILTAGSALLWNLDKMMTGFTSFSFHMKKWTLQNKIASFRAATNNYFHNWFICWLVSEFID